MTFNPFLYDGNVTANATYEEVVIDEKCNAVHLYPVAGVPEVFINEKENLPSLKLYEGTTIENIDGRIRRIYIYGAASVTANVKQLTIPGGEVVR